MRETAAAMRAHPGENDRRIEPLPDGAFRLSLGRVTERVVRTAE